MTKITGEFRDAAFLAWRDRLPPTHWSKYDLSACRLGFDAALAALMDAGFVVAQPFDKVLHEGEGETQEYQLVPTSMLDTYREVIATLKDDRA